MLKRILILALTLASLSRAACSSMAIPTDYLTAAGISRANLAVNFSTIRDAHNSCAVDSLNLLLGVLSGFSGRLQMASNQDMALKIDADANGTNRFAIQGGANDTLFRVREDSTWKFFGTGVMAGAVTGLKITLSDSILAAVARVSGNASVGGTFGVTGASALAALSATSGAFSSLVTATSGISVPDAMGMFSTISSPRDMIKRNGTLLHLGDGDGWTGINYRINSGSFIWSTGSGVTTRMTLNSSGDLTLSALSSGRLLTTSTGGLIAQDNVYWDATNDRLGIGDGATSPAGKLDLRTAQVGGIVQGIAFNSDNTNAASHARWQVTSGGASGGDAYFQASISGVIDWAHGIDNTDADAYVFSEASTLGINNRLRLASGGAVTIPGTLGVTGDFTQTGDIVLPSTDGIIRGSTSDAADNHRTLIVGGGASGDTRGAGIGIRGNEYATLGGSIDLTMGAVSGSAVRFIGGGSVVDSVSSAGKVWASDTMAAVRGFRAGGAGSTDVSLYRSAGDMWTTPDSLTVTGKIIGSDTVVAARGLRTGGGEAFQYGDTTFTVTAGGMSTTVQGTAYATRIGRHVTLALPCLVGTSNGATFNITGIPSGWYPGTTSLAQVVSIGGVNNNGTIEAGGMAYIEGGGAAISLQRSGGAAWTSSGTKSNVPQTSCAVVAYGPTITYVLQ
jgi:fibronectin-binding autotransporter adhesin